MKNQITIVQPASSEAQEVAPLKSKPPGPHGKTELTNQQLLTLVQQTHYLRNSYKTCIALPGLISKPV